MNFTVAIGLCVASSVAYAVAALLQRRLAPHPLTALARNPSWWYALLLNGAGAALHVAALRYGPLLLVQPFGLLTLVLAVVIVAIERNRPVTGPQWRGLGLTCVGLGGLLALIDAGHATTLRADQLPVLLVGTAVLLLTLTVVSRRPAASNLWAAGAAGISFGVASALTQTVTLELSTGNLLAPVALTAATATAALALAGVLFTQVSYRRRFGAALATSTLTNPAAAAGIGIILLGEGFRFGLLGAVLAAACAVLAGSGIALLTVAAEPAPTLPGPRRVPLVARRSRARAGSRRPPDAR
ncbi:hypothetical protein [Micromonospora endophytica]|uniref:Uncharacterized protein n=1 Tax=Micromonospora endophytica TaxID=515350 RepID=A0A2W2E7E2_9ACTN|nr:hypothetical protein [Micromonospora endophytica]PZG00804.1 hypothetical protein C1I93_01435 [Micromonospora endophytica]RIW42073.1 hypothetical protein D3H59_24225 [Micromonospora endophytica]BCJ59663.1 hypothetical protein Jiend_30850 [Micromonospora endophytica]